MKVTSTNISGVYIIEPDVFGDRRGWFMETYSKEKYRAAGIPCDFVQDNHSYSQKKGTLRGLHFQLNPKAQAKIVRCLSGAILDIAVDLREESPTYKKWIGAELTAENKKQIFIPRGFAHGFLTLTDDVEVAYKADAYYAPDCDGGILYSDPEIGIDWGEGPFILSEKDLRAPRLSERTDLNFTYEEMR